MTWPEFLGWLDVEHPAPKKECGGYVAGRLRGARRRAATVISRSIASLDADVASTTFIDDVRRVLPGVAFVAHTTWRHTRVEPRWRIMIPLSCDVSNSEYGGLTRALLSALGPYQFDQKASTHGEQFMWRPASTSPDYEYVVSDGAPLDVEAWLLLAEPEPDPSVSVEGVPEDTPPTGRELEAASDFLIRSAQWMSERDEGERDNGLISKLPTLYRFVLGGFLDEAEVDRQMEEATVASGLSAGDYARVSRSAWQYARSDGAARPQISRPEDDFDVLDESEGRAARILAAPQKYFGKAGVKAQRLSTDVGELCGGVAWGTVDNRLWAYHEGVWRPAGRAVGVVTTALLGEKFRPGHIDLVKTTLEFSQDVPLLTGDPIPEYINCRNGLLDWKTRVLHDHSAEVLSTAQVGVDWDEGAQCPEFEKFLSEVLPEDCLGSEADPGFIWELIGYLLYSGNPLHVAVLLLGKGRNGKGVFLRVLERLLGTRNVSGVTLHDLVGNRFRSADLFGKVANICGDLSPRWLDDTATFKAITGGDSVMAEHKYGAAFSFTPWAVPVYSANRVFGSSDSSEGYFARWVIIPFPVSFLGREDRGLDARLGVEGELRGVLRKGVEALPRLLRRGHFLEPPSVLEAKGQFIRQGDAVRDWLDEFCEFDPEARTTSSDLWEAYVSESDVKGRLSRKEFGIRLGQINEVSPGKYGGTRVYRGVRLKRWGDGTPRDAPQTASLEIVRDFHDNGE